MKKPFEQTLKHVHGSTALVESKKGNIYPVIVSDFVRLKKASQLKVGAIVMVTKANGKYYLVDVKKQEVTDHISEIPLDELGYNY